MVTKLRKFFQANRSASQLCEDVQFARYFDFGKNYRTDIFVEEIDSLQIGITVRIYDKKSGQLVLESDDFQGDEYGFHLFLAEKTIKCNELRVPGGHARKGLGKCFIAGRLKLAQDLGFRYIQNTAGRSDGAYFWSRHGSRLANDAQFKSLKESILRNIKYDQDDLFSIDLVRKIEALLQKTDLYANQKITALPLTQEQIKTLFSGVSFRTVFDLEDPKCWAGYNKSLNRQKQLNIQLIK